MINIIEGYFRLCKREKIGSGTFGNVYKATDSPNIDITSLVCKQPKHQGRPIKYHGDVLKTLRSIGDSKLGKFIVWSVIGKNGDIYMEKLDDFASLFETNRPKDLTVKNEFWEKKDRIIKQFSDWIAECISALWEHRMFFTDFKLLNIGLNTNGANPEFRLIDTDGLVDGNTFTNFICSTVVSFKWNQRHQNTIELSDFYADQKLPPGLINVGFFDLTGCSYFTFKLTALQ